MAGKLKLLVDISEDEKLRNEILKLVRGQITTLVREQFKDIILSALPENKRTEQYLDDMLSKSVTTQVLKAVSTRPFETNYPTDKLEKFIKQEVATILRDKDKFIKHEIEQAVVMQVNIYIKNNLDTIIEERVKQVIGRMLK